MLHNNNNNLHSLFVLSYAAWYGLLSYSATGQLQLWVDLYTYVMWLLILFENWAAVHFKSNWAVSMSPWLGWVIVYTHILLY